MFIGIHYEMSNTKLPSVRELFPDMFEEGYKRSRSSSNASPTLPKELESLSPPDSYITLPPIDNSRLASPSDTYKTSTRSPTSPYSSRDDATPLSPNSDPALRKKRYTCEICHRGFERPSSLATHMNSHTGERPHFCAHPGCSKAFTTRSNMQRHFRSHDCKLNPWPATQSHGYY